MNKLAALALAFMITVVAAASGCANSTARSAGPAGKTCPATQAKSLPKSSPWRRNGWLSARNKALSKRIFNDQRYLARHGIQLTQWGPDTQTGKTKIYLTHYTRTAARALYARYGCAVVVATTSVPRPSQGQ